MTSEPATTQHSETQPTTVQPTTMQPATMQPTMVQPTTMQLGMIGLGRMGANMVRRLSAAGHDCVAYDVNRDAVAAVECEGVRGVATLEELVGTLERPRHIWIMVPAAYVADTVAKLAELLELGDAIIDGGNSWYRDDIDRGIPLAEQGIHFIDVGTSGGVFGLERGYCLMVGGATRRWRASRRSSTRCAPGPVTSSAPRTHRRARDRGARLAALRPERRGSLREDGPQRDRVRPDGCVRGGLNVLAKANVGSELRAKDAETAPLPHPSTTASTSISPRSPELWRSGSVVSSGCSTSTGGPALPRRSPA
jgi:6-phosphogluconate dehydrogenase